MMNKEKFQIAVNSEACGFSGATEKPPEIYSALRLDRCKALPEDERPRERMLKKGPSSLSDQELLAIILNAGIRGKNVFVMARELLNLLDSENNNPQIDKLAALTGLGTAKACTILAMLEFGRRRWGPANTKITHPRDAFKLICHHADRRQEKFLSISLNGAHEVLAVRIVTMGLVNRTLVHPREVFSDPLTDRASAVLVAHSHPSGQLEPSSEDEEITKVLKAAAEILGLRFLDHLIFSCDSYYSFAQVGKIEAPNTPGQNKKGFEALAKE